VTSFVDVLLRAISLSGQALTLGGVAFALLILRPLARQEPDLGRLLRPTLGLTGLGALGVALAQSLAIALRIGSLADEGGWPVADLLATTFSRASLIRLSACLGLVVVCWSLRRRPGSRLSWAALSGLALVLAGSLAWMSHAAGRLQSRGPLMMLTALHLVAASVWVGGLVHLLLVAFRQRATAWSPAVLRRFSALALAAVGTLVAAGAGLSLSYVDGVQALVGTAYGMMVLTKVVVLAGLLVLGGMNFFAVRRISGGIEVSRLRLRRFVEVEVGLGVTVLFAAASLTSAPPAVDVVTDRATLAEVGSRFTPRWPAFSTPTIGQLLVSAAPITDLRAQRRPEEYAWSEYNHHLAGLFVLLVGLLAGLERTGRTRWARHWPLLFLGLAAVLFVRNDPRAWPLGPAGFWESMVLPDVLQHRLFVLLVVAFGLFEWMVRTGRLQAPGWALVFPLLCAASGGLLLTHSHAMFSLKAEFLIEVTHVPLGLLGIFVGWTRWLELRLPPPENRVPGWLWVGGLALMGILLLLYREG
jgi:putative copper resistance protein D